MPHRFICYGKNENNLEITLQRRVIGSKNRSFLSKLSLGDVVLFYLNSSIFAKAEITSQSFTSAENVWPDNSYPFRYKIGNITKFQIPFRFIGTEAHRLIRNEFGTGWGYKFLYFPKELPDATAKVLMDEIEVHVNSSRRIGAEEPKINNLVI